MGIVNNPAIGQGFASLAAAFAPPSGSDLAGYAQSRLGNQKYDQIAQLYAQGATPSERAALTGIQNYGQTPQGFTYGIDANNATSQANNAADNAGALARQMAQPVILDQGQVAHLPEQTQAATGLEDLIMGADKPLSETEVKGAALSQLTPEEQRTLALSDIPIESVIMGDGKTQFVNRPDAVGMTPAPSGGQSIEVNADGSFKIGPAGGGRTTEANDKAGYAYEMALPATQDLLAAFESGALPTANDYRLMSIISSPMSTAIRPELIGQVSPAGQKFYQDLRTALPLQLMTQSGQAVTEQEYDRKMMELLPIAGEDPAVTASKQRQLGLYLDAVQHIAGNAMNKINPPGEAAPAAAAPTYATNPATGERLMLENGQWVPAP